MSEPLLEVTNLVQEFTVRDRGGSRPARPRGLGRLAHAERGRDARAGGRDGLGQVDARPGVAAGPRSQVGLRALSRHRARGPAAACAGPGAASHADGLPGPVQLAGSHLAGAPAGGGAAGRLPGRQRRRAAAPRARGARSGRARSRPLRRPAPARALRRPGAAGGHRPRAGARPGADHLRRGGLLARRPDPRPGAQPARAAALRAGPVLPVHRPRPGNGQAGVRPRGGHVPGQDRGAGPAETLYREPKHPYTVALLASIPSPDPARAGEAVEHTIHGEPPSPIDPPSGCRFRTRCPRAQDICATAEPPLRELGDGHYGACHFPVTADTPTPAATAP